MKKYLFGLLFILLSVIADAQVSIQPVLPLAGIVQKNNLWNVAVISTAPGNLDCRLELTLRDRVTGLEVLTATTGQFAVSTGARQLNASTLLPIQYNYISSSVSVRTDDLIPIGNYIACYRLTAGPKGMLAEECLSFDVEPLSPPMLILPADSALLEVQPSQFTWAPPAPLNIFSHLRYEVHITEVFPGQKAEEAMQQNLAFYTEPNVPVNNLSYRGMAAAFEKEKWYAWQVIATDGNSYAGKSEVWVFKVGAAAPVNVVEGSPYIKMKKNNPESGIAPNGILKLAYPNESGDSLADVHIININDIRQKESVFTVMLNPGENLLQKDLQKLVRAKEGEIYEAYIINSRSEKWRLLFQVHSYKKN